MRYRSSRARREFDTQLDQALQKLGPLYKFAKDHGGEVQLAVESQWRLGGHIYAAFVRGST